MDKLKILLKFSNKFVAKYFIQYIKALLKPILIMILGISIFLLIYRNLTLAYNNLSSIQPIFIIILSLTTLICFFYSFWKILVITYALNFASFNFLKGNNQYQISDFIKQIDQKELAKYVSIVSIIILLVYIPTFIYFSFKCNSLTYLAFNLSSFYGIFIVFLFNTAFLIPVLNYFTQAYFFKKDNENYFNLIFNCYKIDKFGLFIATIFVILTGILSSTMYAFILLFLNMYIYSINTFWYYSKINK